MTNSGSLTMPWPQRLFSLDLRSIAVFRVLLTITILVHLISRIPHLGALYTDSGLLPRSQMLSLVDPIQWSLHAASGQWWWQLLLCIIAALCALALLIGYKTRWMAFASFVLLASLFNRNPVILQTSDTLLMVMTFWSLFLPLNARWSMDAALQAELKIQHNLIRHNPDTAQRYFSMGTIAVLIQIALVYIFSAIYLGLKIPSVTSPSLNANSHITFFAAHAMALSLLIPSALWIALQRRRTRSFAWQRIQSITIYYDEDCGFCLKMCLALRELLLQPGVRIQTAQSDPAIYAIMERHYSWVIKDANNATYIHWQAMQFLFMQRWPFKIIGAIMAFKPFMAMGDRMYHWIAINRYTMSQITTCVIPWRRMSLIPTRAGAAIAGFFILAVMVYNITGLPGMSEYRPSIVDNAVTLTRLNQYWGPGLTGATGD